MPEPYIPAWQKAPSLNDRQGERYATSKQAMTTRLEVKDAKDKADDKKLEQWKRGEAHHIASRADRAVRHDVRNGLHTCLGCHEKFTLCKLFIHQIAKHLFTVGTTTYINGSKKVTFSGKAAA